MYVLPAIEIAKKKKESEKVIRILLMYKFKF